MMENEKIELKSLGEIESAGRAVRNALGFLRMLSGTPTLEVKKLTKSVNPAKFIAEEMDQTSPGCFLSPTCKLWLTLDCV